jgi:hypothetical protein
MGAILIDCYTRSSSLTLLGKWWERLKALPFFSGVSPLSRVRGSDTPAATPRICVQGRISALRHSGLLMCHEI